MNTDSFMPPMPAQLSWGRLVVALVAAAYFAYYASTAHGWHFIDYVNLIIHEAGHLIFIPLGEFMRILGGSLLQIVMPMAFVAYFYLQQQYFSASLVAFWVGQNLINVSVYAADARWMELPLLGGDAVTHDWNQILSMLHALDAAPQVGAALFGTGLLVLCAATVSSLRFSVAKDDTVRTD